MNANREGEHTDKVLGEIDEILWGFENDRRWDSLGEAVNDVPFLDHEAATQAIKNIISKERIKAKIEAYEALLDDHQFFAPTHKQLNDRIKELRSEL